MTIETLRKKLRKAAKEDDILLHVKSVKREDDRIIITTVKIK